MPQSSGPGELFRPGSWWSVGLIYLYGVLTSASLSKVIPLLGDVGAHLGATPGQFALLISLMTLVPAVLASVAGSIIDRMGARSALMLAAAVGAVCNLAYLFAASLPAFMAVRVLEGFIAVGAYSAAPALIMATTDGARRGRAMAVWSTYTPVGMSLGLVLSGSFAGSDSWRGGYLIHMLLFAALVLAGLLLPRTRPARSLQPEGLLATWSRSGPLRLSMCFAMLVFMGFGMSTVFPEWFASQHGVPVGRASTILAMTNLTMIPGGLLAGWLLANTRRESVLFGLLMAGALAVSLPLFRPGPDELQRIMAMIGWLMLQGASIAVVTASLPRVVANPAQGAAAAGLLSQLAALITFGTPLVWQPILHSGRWGWFVAVVAVAAAAAWMVYPARKVSASAG